MTDLTQSTLIADFKFCHACGAKLHKSAATCPQCGAQQTIATALAAPKNPGTWQQLYFGAEGRIGRKQWWIAHVKISVPVVVLAVLVSILATPETPENLLLREVLGLGLIVYWLIAVWSAICINAKRWHDRDYSGWMQLVGLIPVIGWIWALVENGFLRGTQGPNRYGPDPLAEK